MSDDTRLDPRFTAAVDLIGRTGATSFRVGYNDEDTPTVWFACASYVQKVEGLNPTVRFDEASAALDPLTAMFRLCEQLIDGGTCTHCHRPTIFDPSPMDHIVDDMLDAMGCRYIYDPELATFRRSCEGDT